MFVCRHLRLCPESPISAAAASSASSAAANDLNAKARLSASARRNTSQRSATMRAASRHLLRARLSRRDANSSVRIERLLTALSESHCPRFTTRRAAGSIGLRYRRDPRLDAPSEDDATDGPLATSDVSAPPPRTSVVCTLPAGRGVHPRHQVLAFQQRDRCSRHGTACREGGADPRVGTDPAQ